MTYDPELKKELQMQIEHIMHFLYDSQSVLRAGKKNKSVRHYRLLATYGAESWTPNKDIAKRLAPFERKVLRRMFGEIKINELEKAKN